MSLKVEVDSLSAEQKKVVDFAVVQLQGLEEGEGECSKKLLRVENFSEQVRIKDIYRTFTGHLQDI